MSDSIIMERVSDAMAGCFCGELLRTEGFETFGLLVTTLLNGTAVPGTDVSRQQLRCAKSPLIETSPAAFLHESSQVVRSGSFVVRDEKRAEL